MKSLIAVVRRRRSFLKGTLLVCSVGAAAVLAAMWANRDELTTPIRAASVDPVSVAIVPSLTSDVTDVAHIKSPISLAGVSAHPVEQPLPPEDAPLPSIFDELVQRARSGDARAGCDLASRLVRCRQWHAQQRYMPTLVNHLSYDSEIEAENLEHIVDSLAGDQNRLAELASVCEGMKPEDLDRSYEFQVLAAELGPSQYRMELVLNPVLSRDNFVNELDRWHDYRARVPRYLNEAMQAGNSEAVLQLALFYSPDRSVGHVGAGNVGVVQPDAAHAALFFALYQEQLGHTLSPDAQAAYDAARELLPPEQMGQLRSRAAMLRRQHFVAAAPSSQVTHTPEDEFDPERLHSGLPNCDRD